MKLKHLIGFRYKYRILLFIQQFKPLKFFKYRKLLNKKKYAYVFLAADYGNLGDLAITFAQIKFIKEFSDYEVVEIPISESLEGLYFVRKHIKGEDIVTIIGGGNLGDLYDQIEYIRQLVVKFFPKNKIISFPQTFDFSNTKNGHKALESAKKAYNSHNDIHFVAREEISYKLIKTHFFKAKSYLTPDIVLSLERKKANLRRNGVVFCLRQDKEKKLTDKQTSFIKSIVTKKFKFISFYDTHIRKNKLSSENRNFELNSIWKAFSSAELVITDRLHGMIFCFITSTPCLVFQNNNHKIKGTYQWIKDDLNITMIENFTEACIRDFFEKKDFTDINSFSLTHEFQPLRNLIV